MTTTTLTKVARTVIPAGTSNAAAGTTREAIDTPGLGGILTIKLTNGGSGPAIAPTVTISIAHDAGVTPAEGAEGAVWKRLSQVGGDTVANSINQFVEIIPPAAMHIQVEVTGNTSQAVTCEAYYSELTNAVTA